MRIHFVCCLLLTATQGKGHPLPTPGVTYSATVKSTTSYGAFCAIQGYADGLVHISQLDPEGRRLASVGDLVSVGDRLRVRVLNLDDGKVSLTLRSVQQDAAAPEAIRLWTPEVVLGAPPSAEDLGRLQCLVFSYSRSSGSGGQNVNKLSTKCEARLRVDETPWPQAVKVRLKNGPGQVTSSGDLIVVSERHRTQAANRKDALDKLVGLVVAAWHPPKARRQRMGLSAQGKRVRRDEKKRTSEKKRSRSASKRGHFDSRRTALACGLSRVAAAVAIWITGGANLCPAHAVGDAQGAAAKGEERDALPPATVMLRVADVTAFQEDVLRTTATATAEERDRMGIRLAR